MAKQRTGRTSQPEPRGGLPFRRESPERARPSVVEVLGISLQSCPLRVPSGGRVQRGRSPLWWGLGGTPQSCPLRGPFRRESPERAQPPSVGARGIPPKAVRSGSLPAGESREGAALFGGGFGEPPKAVRSGPFRRENPERARPSSVGGWGNPPKLSAPGPLRRESPERAQPSLVGAWGNTPTPIRSASRQGSGLTSGVGDGHTPTQSRGPRTNTEPLVNLVEAGSIVNLSSLSRCPLRPRAVPDSPIRRRGPQRSRPCQRRSVRTEQGSRRPRLPNLAVRRPRP